MIKTLNSKLWSWNIVDFKLRNVPYSFPDHLSCPLQLNCRNMIFFLLFFPESGRWIMFSSHVKCDGWEVVFPLARFLIISPFSHSKRVLDRQYGARSLLCTLRTDVQLSAESKTYAGSGFSEFCSAEESPLSVLPWVESASQDLPCLNKPWQSELPPAIASWTHLSLADALSTQTSAVSLCHTA